jgi:hypothetical protein
MIEQRVFKRSYGFAMEHSAQNQTLPATSGSTAATLKAIASKNKPAIALTFSLIGLENLLLVAYPLLAGMAIDAIAQKNWAIASIYALVVLLFWLIGALRRAVDTRVFAGIYARLAVPVVVNQRAATNDHSVVAARVTLAREFVDFFEHHVPAILTSVVSIVGAVVMLLVIEPWLGAASLVALVIFIIAMRRIVIGNQLLHERLHNQQEREVDRVKRAPRTLLDKHYRFLAKLRIMVSDIEAKAYIGVGLGAASLFLLAITLLVYKPDVSPGHVYAVMTYLWNYVTSLDDGPGLADQFARLRDIGRRVQTEGLPTN